MALIDYRLGAGQNGLSLIGELRALSPQLRAALVTSDADPQLTARAQRIDVTVMSKPVAGEQLQAFVAGLETAAG